MFQPFDNFFAGNRRIRIVHPVGLVKLIKANHHLRNAFRFGYALLVVSVRKRWRMSAGRTYLSAIERSERNISIDNIARIAKGLKIEPWRL